MSQTGSKWLFYIVSVLILYLLFCAVLPFVHRYEMQADLNAAAVYCTKHTVASTRKLLMSDTSGRGYAFDPGDFNIEKDAQDTVRISYSYSDVISIFGYTVKDLNFTLEARRRNIKAAF